MTLDPGTLDPGIRFVVQTLRTWGFRTTDSGDGQSKPEEQREIQIPHVVMVIEDPACLVAEANRLASLLSSIGVEIVPIGPDDTNVEIHATYDAADRSATLILLGLNDEVLDGLVRRSPHWHAALEYLSLKKQPIGDS